MKKIKDERLKEQNLKNIRIIYIVQTAAIILLLGWKLATEGFDAMTASPLWFVFIGTGVLSALLSMRISIDQEESTKKPASYLIYIILSIVVGCIFAAIIWFTTKDMGMAFIIGGIFTVCFLGSYTVMYVLKRKRWTEEIEEQ